MEPRSDDRTNGHAPIRDPAVADALARAMQAMREAETDHGKLLAVREGAEALDRISDDGSGALDELSDSAILVHNLNANDVQTALAQGAALALDARGRAIRVNGNGQLPHGARQPTGFTVSEFLPSPAKTAKPDSDWWRSKLIDVQELCDRRFPDLKYVVPGLFPEGAILLASRPKFGKSWLILQITTAVAGGTITLAASDRSPPVGDVLYLALEDNPRRLQRRLTKYFGSLRETWPARLKLVTEWKRLDQGGLDGIREWCHSVPSPVLVAIDTLKRVRPPKRSGQNDYDADYEACQGLQTLAGELGISIIVAHHDRKMEADDPFDTVSGTLGLTGAVDAIAVLKRSAHGVTMHIRGRDMDDEIEKAVRFDREACRWAILGEATEIQRSTERDRVLKALGDAPEGLSTSEIMAMAEFATRNAADLALSRMATDAIIERVKRGLYGLPGTRAKLASKKDRQIDRSEPKGSQTQ